MDITIYHIYFALAFTAVFALIMVFLYRKDLKMHQKNYKRSWVIILAILVFLILFILLKDRLIKL